MFGTLSATLALGLASSPLTSFPTRPASPPSPAPRRGVASCWCVVASDFGTEFKPAVAFRLFVVPLTLEQIAAPWVILLDDEAPVGAVGFMRKRVPSVSPLATDQIADSPETHERRDSTVIDLKQQPVSENKPRVERN